MKKYILSLLLVIAGISVQAQAPTGYYDNATGKTGQELRAALHDIIKGHTTITYQQIWSAFWSTDNKGNGVVWDMYSDGANYTYYYTNSNDQCGEYAQEGDCYNREHSWPKSWFSGGEDGVPGRDLHHIFPTDGFVNSQRGNYPFGEVGSGTSTTFQNGSKLGNCKSTLGYSGKVYEPIDEYKGDFARAYFYMSTRYYTEDSDWGSSGMTNKADLKDWAVAMLLDWSDNDPVSQKEIDRNNAVYGIQGNRNPFIDHPEYAHIIWEPSWTGVTYNITTAAVTHGTISAPSTAVEGTMVALSATPAQGYMLGSWSVYKTGDPSTTVSVSGNGTFTMPSFNVTVSATFVQNSTSYTITCTSGLAHGSINASVNSATSGTSITLSNTPSNGYTLYSYYVYKTGDLSTVVHSGTGNTFTMPAFDVTVSASFVQPSSYSYVKVTSASDITNDDYLIVCENNNVAMNGNLTNLDAPNNFIDVTINGNTIEATSTINAAIFAITQSGSNYTIKSNSGYYIGATGNSNSLNSSTSTAYTNTVNYNSGDIDIVGSGGAYLRYNSSDLRFRYYKSSTYTSQKSIQLYKKTGAAATPTHTIQFNPNGASGTSYLQTVNEFEPTALQDNTFVYEGYAFDNWNTESDGSGISYFNGAIVTLLNDLTLYAQWKQFYNISLTAPGNGNSISASHSQAVEGDIITLTATPATGYEFDGWNVTTGGQTISVNENSFEMPAGNVTVSASFVFVGQAFEQKYYLVTSTDQLIAGRKYLIVNTAAGKAMGTTQNTKNRAAVDVTVSSNTIESIGTTVCELTLGGAIGAWTFFDSDYGDTGGYLYAASSSDNQLKTQATNDANGLWSISIASNGAATIVAQGNKTRNNLRYNTSGFFSCYASSASTSQMPLASLYIRSEDYSHDFSETVTTILPFDRHTVASGATLTVTGTATCNDPSLLVIEDGGQFIHHNDGVKATFKKAIAAYTTDSDGWYTIASPFTAFDPTQVITDNYDLYAYDEDGDKEWINYKHPQNTFPTAPCTGYLYAHNPSTTLRTTGILNSGDYNATLPLSYANSLDDLKGFNLLGNPTAHDITFNKTGNVSDGYYYLNDSDTWSYEPSNAVPAGRGFLVKANAEGQSVTLNPSAKRGEHWQAASFLKIDVDGEQAYVELTEGVSMPLLGFRGRQSSVYLSQEGKPYIMLVRNNADAVDLCYKPMSGTHTLSVKAEGSDLDYLHLIDHLTGSDVNLLATPSYSFESSESDFAMRFRLVFDADEAIGSNDVFAYVKDGQIVIPNISGPYELQVIDMTGRLVDTLTPGIYVLRLITSDKIRTQKLIVH